MKNLIKRIAREEHGSVLTIALILLVVGGLLLAPLLGLMSTGLVSGQVYEKKTAALYAADAGIEDAIWKLANMVEGLPDDPYPLGREVNGMDVTVAKIGERPDGDDATVYTIRSTARRDATMTADLVAEVRWQALPMVEGSSPGTWSVPPPYADILTTLSRTSIAFGMQLGQGKTSEFWAFGDEEPVDFGKNDLLGLDLAGFHAWVWFSSDSYSVSQGDSIGDAHYYVDGEDGYQYLLTFLTSPNTKVGSNELAVNRDNTIDVVAFHVDPADAERFEADLFLGDILRHFSSCGNPGVSALGRLEHGDGRHTDGNGQNLTGQLLFSLDKQSSLVDPFSGTFTESQVIILDLGDPHDPDYPSPTSYDLYLDAWTSILAAVPGQTINSAPAIVALSPLSAWEWGGQQHPDGRLLLALDTNQKDIIGSDGRMIKPGDIAIWTPEGWDYDENPATKELEIVDYGEPFSAAHPGEITLHIDMRGSGAFVYYFVIVKILSWNIEG